MKHHVLLTGATGFVGKVVLCDLLRRRKQLGIGRVSVLIRSKASRGGALKSPSERFAQGVAQAAIFRALPAGWEQFVNVVGAELEQADMGLSPGDAQSLEASVTHVLHCAASVEFDLPIASALAANVNSALHVLEFSRRCSQLVGMVSVSTAYVSVWRNEPIYEALAHLPRPAAEIRRSILEGTSIEAELLAESGHPNTYTYTKCLAEHLLSEGRGSVPVTVVRPSIISASWADPQPGWIDSKAAFAGCLLYTGLGIIKAWEADPNVRLDVVPVDAVSRSVIDAAFAGEMPQPGEPMPIRFAAMGLARAMRADMSTQATARFFRERPGAKFAPGCFIGGVRHGFLHQDLFRRALPVQASRAFLALTGKKKQRRQLEKVDEQVQRLNAAFSYFIHHSFDFRPSTPISLPGFSPTRYIDIVNRGIYRHLLRRDETELSLAGERHDDVHGDLRWAMKKPGGNPVVRSLGVALRKALRRCTTVVTFDRKSFERAMAEIPPGQLLVLAPSHRSYFDFLLSSYLCFQHPELGIPVPKIAAAEEFSRIPLVSRILTRSGAFYVRRGVGKAVPEVGRELERIAKLSAAMMFFIEGQRSRGRRVLPPKRGLLRALQATGRSFSVLPLAISYERVPEESAFDRELRGGKRSAMSLEAIVRWLVCLARGQVQLGRVHIACGNPLDLDKTTDVQGLARNVAAELQSKTVVTEFHLRMFLAHGLPTEVEGIDEAFVARAIERRGGRVLRSQTPLPSDPAPSLIQSLQNQWIHWFYADAAELFPEDRAVRDQVARHSWKAPQNAADVADPRICAVVRALFNPVIQVYDLVTQHVSEAPPELTSTGPLSMVHDHPAAYLPHLEDAFRSLSEHGVLLEVQPGRYAPAAAGAPAWGASNGSSPPH